jgi:hypothetical protein
VWCVVLVLMGNRGRELEVVVVRRARRPRRIGDGRPSTDAIFVSVIVGSLSPRERVLHQAEPDGQFNCFLPEPEVIQQIEVSDTQFGEYSSESALLRANPGLHCRLRGVDTGRGCEIS